ncbi:MAG: molybdopterin-dependent oxidoreductase, partial [Nocardioides sp.]
MASEVKHGVCNLCEAICGLKITLTDGAITDIRGDQDDPLSRGHICPKGVALADLYADPDRLRRPLRRRRNPADPTGASDTWDELGWPEALDLAASRLAEVIARGGRDSVGVYLGNPNAHSLGFATHGLALVKSLGTKNLFSASSVDQLPHQLVAHWMFGHQLMLPIPDLDRTDHFLVIGANPMASNGSLMTAPDFPSRMRELRQRGGRLVVLDPRRTETAKIADEHHFVRPGSDVFVVLAMVATLIAEGVATWPAYAAVDRAQLEAALAPFTPERAEAASGLPAADVCRLAREFAAAKAAVAYGRLGVSATEHGTLGVWAITLLNTLTGNLDQAGGAMFTTPAIDIVGRRIVGPGHHGLWHSRVRGLPETANEFPVAALAEEIQTPGKGQIKALLTIAGNPVLSTPDGAGLERALAELDFMVAVDFYLNETTRHADLILPPTSHLERDHYDLAFSALAVRNTARFTTAVLSTQAGSLADWRIFAGLARRLATKTRLPLRKRLKLSARLAASPRQIVRLLLRQGDSGLTLAAVLARPSGVDLGPLRPG